jgi:hypothetical protein
LALALSVLFHLAVGAAWQYSATLERIFPLFGAAKQAFTTTPEETQRRIELAQRERERLPTLTFIETDDRQRSDADPEDAKFYSDRATVAQNPDAKTEKRGDTPYLEGTETRVMATEDVPIPKPASPSRAFPLPSAPEMAEQKPEKIEVASLPKPKEIAEIGEKLAKPEREIAEAAREQPEKTVTRVQAAPTSEPPMPSSAREVMTAKAALTASSVDKTGVAAFNVAASPFGEYDKRLIAAVASRWHALVEKHGMYARAGAVQLQFELMQDGSVRNLRVAENTAGDILALYCEKAIVDSAPFDPLPDSLRVLIGNDPREVRFTFYY